MTREVALFFAGVAIEVIVSGLGVAGVLTPSQGWIIAGFGCLFFIPIIAHWFSSRHSPGRPLDVDRFERMAATLYKEPWSKRVFRKIRLSAEIPRSRLQEDSHAKLARAIEEAERNKRHERMLDKLRFGQEDMRKRKRQALLVLREAGVALYHQRVLGSVQWEPWRQQFENWHARILEAANDLDPELRAILSPLRECPEHHTWALNRDHELAQSMIWETCARIEKYLDQTR